MPRPRRDSEILPAKDRLENAFWELLSEREYNKITVTDIVRTADVNRNSFYYHFSGLPELADSAILHAVEDTPMPGVPGRDFNPDTEWRKHVTALLRDPEQRQRLDRLALLAGPHSSPELVSSLKEFGRLTMISVLGLDADSLDLQNRSHARFHRRRHAGRTAALAETACKNCRSTPYSTRTSPYSRRACSCQCRKRTCSNTGAGSSAKDSYPAWRFRNSSRRLPSDHRKPAVTIQW